MYYIDTQKNETLLNIAKIAAHKQTLISLSNENTTLICKNYEYIHNKIRNSNTMLYGINTGFGHLCNVAISPENLNELQQNLLMSHACGVGKEVPPSLVRIMLLLKIRSLSYGYSGVSLELIQRLVNMYNYNILPVVYTQGSLGASGDLAPLAHLSLPLIGMGMVYYKGKKYNANTVLKLLNWNELHLQAKEGLALINGTQFMNAYGVWCIAAAKKLWAVANLIAAISVEGFDGIPNAFAGCIQKIRHHKGQIKTAKKMRRYLKGSEIANAPKTHVQDPYSFRCIPQVHGACWQAIKHAKAIFTNELNAVTDNPLVFSKMDKVISGGNFHGQPLAMAFDYLSIALAEIGSISERRTYQLISGARGLPGVLALHSGLHSGLLIPQYTAASLVSQNKQLCAPASVDSIVSSNGQEDHVSMGANAALKCYEVVQNLQNILAIELLTATQALHFRKNMGVKKSGEEATELKSSALIEQIVALYRKQVPFIDKDRYLAADIEKSNLFLDKIYELLVVKKTKNKAEKK